MNPLPNTFTRATPLPVLALLWVLAVPPVAMVAGQTAWITAWLLAGVLVWGFRRRLGPVWEHLQKRRWSLALEQQPWLLLTLMGLLGLALWRAIPLWAVSLWVMLKALGVAAPALLILLGFVLLLIQKKHQRGFLFSSAFWWLAGTAVLALQAMLGGEGARGLDLPIPLGFWGMWFLVASLVRRTGPPFWLCALTLTNLLMVCATVTFYSHPLSAQQRRVTRQKGVTQLAANPRLDYRWVQEGCGPGRYWMGVKDASRVGVRYTLQVGKKLLKVGQLTSDNGVVNCALKMVGVGDQDSGGGLHVLDETTARPLSRVRQPHQASGFSFGFSGVEDLPSHGWLLAGKEKAHEVYWLRLQNPRRPRYTVLGEHATFLVVCRLSPTPCYFGVAPGQVHKRWGGGLEHRLFKTRSSSTLGPDMALDEKHHRLYVSDHLWGKLEVRNTSTLGLIGTRRIPVGVRYMKHWPATGKVWMADYLSGWFYTLDAQGHLQRALYAGRKTRWLNLSRDGKSLLWCAASACYRYSLANPK